MELQKSIVVFGGSGFIGSHLAIYYLQNSLTDHVVMVDLVAPDFSKLPPELKSFFDQGRIDFIPMDVRKPLQSQKLPKQVDKIFNLAAVHREPGHKESEYFETNLLGAEHVCEWASEVGCNYVVFTSSIATYGTLNSGPKSESSLPTPLTPYGISKLVAEKIHKEWQIATPGRKLLIVRPGVIYGTGEAGNITRMVRGIIKGYFVYTGNKEVIKAGGYVKDLVRSIDWMIKHQQKTDEGVILYNFSLHPPATLEKYAQAIMEVSGRKRKIWNIPFRLLLPASAVVSFFSNIFGIKQPINPARVRKLLRQNNIIPHELLNSGFEYKYSLKESLEDWKNEHPSDWK